MKELTIEITECTSGGVSAAVMCGIGVGLALGTGGNIFAIAFAISVCLPGDS
jgi:di/tricarboxylate transporter